MDTIRVMVADDEEGIRDVLEAVIATDSTLQLVGAAGEAEAAIQMACSERPDVALVDVRMPGGGGVRAAREIVRHTLGTKVIALSAFEDSQTVLAMLRAGAATYIAKSDPTDEILDAIHRVVEVPQLPEPESARIVRALDECTDRGAHRSSLVHLRGMRIDRALRPGAFEIRLRSVVDLESGNEVGAEARALFVTAPRRRADVWLAEAQAIGMLAPMETAIVHSALAELDRMPEDRWLALPVSPTTARSGELREALEATPAERIVIQLTEQAPFDDPGSLEASLLQFRRQGFRLSLADTGSQVASLRNLVHIRPDFVRIDSTLTQGVAAEPTRRVLVGALASIAADLGAVVIAESVTAGPDAELLQELGVSLGCREVNDSFASISRQEES